MNLWLRQAASEGTADGGVMAAVHNEVGKSNASLLFVSKGRERKRERGDCVESREREAKGNKRSLF